MHDVPGDREDGSSSFVHLAIIFSGKLSQINPFILLPLWSFLFSITYLLWQRNLVLLFVSFIFYILDWINLACLPVKKRSWGPVTPPLLGLTLLRFVFRNLLSLLAPSPWRSIITLVFDASISLIAFYATWLEPFQLQLTQFQIHLPSEILKSTVRILHISDIHFERLSLREEKLLDMIKVLSPDVIFLTGDYLNLSSIYDHVAQHGIRELLSQINAPLGVFAVPGSPAVDQPQTVPGIFQGLSIQWIHEKFVPLPVEDNHIYLVGILNTYEENRDNQSLIELTKQLPGNCYSILLYHTPDLMPLASRLGVNLYLCGHTHGGQISLPVFGALVTSSKYGKRYERGLYHQHNTYLYVSRGLGMEGMGAPRARLCSPPEIILWTLLPDSNRSLTDGATVV